MLLKGTLKNKSKLLATYKSPNDWNTVPSTKTSKESKFEDQKVSINDFEAFCNISFVVAPSAKPINACRSVLQELERALKQAHECTKSWAIRVTSAQFLTCLVFFDLVSLP